MWRNLVLVGVAMAASGCVSWTGYWADRGRDAKDIVTATVGEGAGAKARVGPVNAGLFLNEDYAGLRGGECFYEPHGWWEDGSGDAVLLLLLGGETFDYQWRPPPRSDDYMRPPGRFRTVGDDLAARNKSFRFVLHPTCKPEFPRTPCYYTQIEAAVGVWGSLRLGFNPGELLDFLLGWTTLDIFSDDLEARREREEAEKAKEPPPTAPPAPATSSVPPAGS